MSDASAPPPTAAAHEDDTQSLRTLGDTPRAETRAEARQAVAGPPAGLRARLWWTVVLALVAVALVGVATALTAAALEPTIWVAVGAAAGWLVVLLGALLAVNAAVRPLGAQLAAEHAARVSAERAAWEAQWRDDSNRAALEEQQRATVLAVAQVNAALTDSVRELSRVAELIRGGDSPAVQPPALPAEAWPAPLGDLQAGVRQLVQASFGVATLTAAHQPVGVLITLARRLQPLIHRAIKELDALESQVEDPDLLNALFQLDHLVTRARRQAESIAVLGGATARQIRKPVPVYTVLRQAIAEIEHYGRVKVLRPVQGTIVGHAVTEVIHLIAELIENATAFSPPDSKVQVQVDLVPDGLSIEIDDLGLVMSAELRQRMNQLLTEPERLDVGEQLKDGRIGLIVVAAIARRYRIRVRLERNERGGNRALVVLPAKLLSEEPARRQEPGRSALPAGAPAPAVAVSTAPAAPTGPRARPGPAAGPTLPVRPASPTAPDPAAADVSAGAPPAVTLSEADRQRLAELSRAAFGDVDRSRGAHPVPRGTAAVDTPPDRPVDPARPPLPRRDGQHMVPELRNAARPDADAPGAGQHNPGLFASYRRGRERAGTEEPPDAPSAQPTD